VSREIHADVITELAKDSFQMAHLILIDFETPIYITECISDIIFDGNTYASSGALQGISAVTETTEVQVGAVSLTLSGVSQEYISILLNNAYIDKQVTISRVLMDPYLQIIGTPILMYDGRITNFAINDTMETSNVTITAASHWSDFNKKSGRRTNHNSQQIFFNGDKGFEFAPKIMRDLKWGKA
tara:strand:- start:1847 stop:2401 length:555 start_codon:yes stop_codon:yes gene_type:complete